MTFSPGQNGKGAEKIKQIGKLKKNGFCKQKRQSRDKTRPAFNKETTIVQPNALWKIVAATHHHELRSPQKRAKTTDFAEIEAAEEVVLPHIDVSPADAEQAAEELHTPHYVPPVAVRPQRLCLKRRIIENSSIFDEALSVLPFNPRELYYVDHTYTYICI